ncbi:FadR/GntR family transcriptional regulator [Ferroacidibacillus organovorans]|uniref:HTH gntR-type domain-containing protein n=1 Tax=Ferroacidibacillus organovorans TaxID=1765683 RepID=A0A1V4EQP6_9BACL|nr:FadR/GntR family transcriptional regulator [Ferroacidibacillus organovorans]OPG15247.1 hypothetical protein B2M26_12310 [Ferroacidibacillus organovorans]
MANVQNSSKTRYVRVADQIESMIMRGEWQPGQRLPTLEELATMFAVSRAVVREACSVLVGAGLIEVRHGDGIYVKSFSLDSFLRPIHAAILLAASDARALLEVGMWLEGGIVEQATQRRRRQDCEFLSETLFMMEASREDAGRMMECERQFHVTLSECAGNEVAVNLLRILYQPLTGVMNLLLMDEDFRDEMITLHRALYDSIAVQDGESAKRHIQLYRRRAMDAMRNAK